jgi:diguanylate cyclase
MHARALAGERWGNALESQPVTPGGTAAFAGDAPEQEHRVQRFLLAAAASLTALGLFFLLAWQGYLEPEGFMYASTCMLVLFVVGYAGLRSGVNQALSDPSLILPLMTGAIVTVHVAMFYATAEGRSVLLHLLPLVFFFGVYRLETGRMLMLAGFTVLCYGGLLAALISFRPGNDDAQLGSLRLVVLTVVLVWLAVLGGRIGRQRNQLSRRHSDLLFALDRSEERATRDELTGMHNRRYILELLSHERERCGRTGLPFSVCMIDIDHFKQINDTLGHPAGDEVLKGYARHLMAQMRETDSVGRYGGEEFLLVFAHTGLAGAAVSAERVRTRTAALKLPPPAPQIPITVSIGVAEFRHGETIEETIARADRALYNAKELGRNQVALELAAGAEPAAIN